MPQLESEVKEMADEWTDVQFQGRTINFKYNFRDRTNIALLPTWDKKTS